MDRYAVAKSANQPTCQCDNCIQWTITFEQDGEPMEWSRSFEGLLGKEAAEELCSDLNDAFNATREPCKAGCSLGHHVFTHGSEMRYWCPVTMRIWAETLPCDKLEGCWKSLGHEGDCEDDIPF